MAEDLAGDGRAWPAGADDDYFDGPGEATAGRPRAEAELDYRADDDRARAAECEAAPSTAVFGPDGRAESMPPGPVLSTLVEQAVRDDLAEMSDDEVIGAVAAARRLRRRAEWLELLARSAGGPPSWPCAWTLNPSGSACSAPPGRRPASRSFSSDRATTGSAAARTATCPAPGCGASAHYADIDHTIPWPGGPTAEGNLGPTCRHHHRAKQAPGWKLEQPEPGVFRWTTPAGRGYQTRPTRYDI
jgi:hypothetical protein